MSALPRLRKCIAAGVALVAAQACQPPRPPDAVSEPEAGPTYLSRSDALGASLADDAESGALIPPWTSTEGAVSSALDAGHRGARGLLVTDSNSGAGVGAEATLEYDTGTVFNEDWYGRTWVKVLASSGVTAEFSLFDIKEAGVGTTSMYVKLVSPSLRIGVGSDATPTVLGARSLTLNSWHLLEFVIRGANTANGRRTLWLDGTLEVDDTNANFAGKPLDVVMLVLWGDRSWTGAFAFDDVRMSTTPHASKLIPSIPTLTPGECTPIAIQLVDSVSGAPASAPYNFAATLTVSGVSGTFHDTPDCIGTQATATFSAGASSVSAYFRPERPGTAVISAGYEDFLSLTASADVAAASPLDAGAAADGGELPAPDLPSPLGLRVGCECGMAVAPDSALLAVTVLLAVRRRARTARA